jgi:hypothetical protein
LRACNGSAVCIQLWKKAYSGSLQAFKEAQSAYGEALHLCNDSLLANSAWRNAYSGASKACLEAWPAFREALHVCNGISEACNAVRDGFVAIAAACNAARIRFGAAPGACRVVRCAFNRTEISQDGTSAVNSDVRSEEDTSQQAISTTFQGSERASHVNTDFLCCFSGVLITTRSRPHLLR